MLRVIGNLLCVLFLLPGLTSRVLAQSQADGEVDFVARIQNSPEIAQEIGLAKLSPNELKRLNSVLNAAYALGFEAGKEARNSESQQDSDGPSGASGDVRVGGIQRDRPCGPPIKKENVELIQVAPEDARNVYEYADKNGLEIRARRDGDLGAARTITGTARAESAKRGCQVVFHMYAGPGDHGITLWNEFTKSYQKLESQAVVYWFAMPKQK